MTKPNIAHAIGAAAIAVKALDVLRREGLTRIVAGWGRPSPSVRDSPSHSAHMKITR
jgi:hypothetical protein